MKLNFIVFSVACKPTYLKLFEFFVIGINSFLNFHTHDFNLLKLLIDGDVESNPGPTNNFVVLKSVQGSFHQGSSKFGPTAGIQCSINSLLAICWSKFRRISIWKTFDLDFILNEGDKNFKKLNVHNILAVDELPNHVSIVDKPVNVIYLALITGELFQGGAINFVDINYIRESGAYGVILFMRGICVAILCHNEHFFVFDSHSRSANGEVVNNGTSVLLKFGTLMEIRNYLCHAHLRETASCFFSIKIFKISR